MNRFFFAAFLAAMVLTLSGCEKKEAMWYDEYPIVAHALGNSGGESENCLEGFNWSYENGQRIFECDFAQTSDGYLVLAHSFSETGQEGIDDDHIPTLETFLNTPIDGQFTPLSLDDLLALMDEHPDMRLVTDFKSGDEEVTRTQFEIFESAVRKAGGDELKNRIIIQLYDEAELAPVKKQGPWGGYIFTLYKRGFEKTEEDFESVASFCRRNGIDVLVMKKGKWSSRYAPIAKRYGIKVYPHTIYTRWEAERMIRSKADGAYSNSVLPSEYEELKKIGPRWYKEGGGVFALVSDKAGAEAAYASGKKCVMPESPDPETVTSLLKEHGDLFVGVYFDEELMASLVSEGGDTSYLQRLVIFTKKLKIFKNLKKQIFWCDIVYDAQGLIKDEKSFDDTLDDAKEAGMSVVAIDQQSWREEYRALITPGDVQVYIFETGLIR